MQITQINLHSNKGDVSICIMDVVMRQHDIPWHCMSVILLTTCTRNKEKLLFIQVIIHFRWKRSNMNQVFFFPANLLARFFLTSCPCEAYTRNEQSSCQWDRNAWTTIKIFSVPTLSCWTKNLFFVFHGALGDLPLLPVLYNIPGEI